MKPAVNLDDYRELARRRLPKIVFDFLDSGVEDETGLRRNRSCFERYRLVPRSLVDVSRIDQKTEIFGQTFKSPFGIAPMGVAGLFRRGADLMMAEAAAELDIPYVMSGVSSDSVQSACAVSGDNTWFQIYGARDSKITFDFLEYVADAGIKVLVFTVDVPVNGKRERNMRNGFRRPMKLSASTLFQGMMHPAWAMDFLRGGGLPMTQNWARFVPGADANGVADFYSKQVPAPLQSWDMLRDIRKRWNGTLVVKGVLNVTDARTCIDLGADGLVISNHGGRQLDRAPAPIEVLPAIRAAVGPGVPILCDSGFRRGSDVVIAKCLGADFVWIGRPVLFATAALGAQGAKDALRMMKAEIDMTLGLLGCPSFHALNGEYLLEA